MLIILSEVNVVLKFGYDKPHKRFIFADEMYADRRGWRHAAGRAEEVNIDSISVNQVIMNMLFASPMFQNAKQWMILSLIFSPQPC